MTERYERIFSHTSFGFFAIVLVCLILLTPADAIYQCYETDRLTNIFFIAGAYVITFLLAILIYATRIYTNRSTVAKIPKAWIPVEKEDINKSVRRLVMEGLARSAVISYQARPRDISSEAESFQRYRSLRIDPEHPPWGVVEHPGWSSPSSPDLPNLPYRTVIQELPNLIEAKAVSLAPADSLSSAASESFPDTQVVEVLQRPASMGLRQYIQHLILLEVIKPPELGSDFMAVYEKARFSSRELHESEFRELMHLFAEILRGMTTLAPPVLDEIRDSASYRRAGSDSIIALSGEGPMAYHERGYDGASSSLRSNSLRPSNASSWETQSGYNTAPASQSPVSGLSSVRGSSLRGPLRTPSTRSLRRVYSGQSSSSSGGSVIRLRQTQAPDELPYSINYAGRSD